MARLCQATILWENPVDAARVLSSSFRLCLRIGDGEIHIVQKSGQTLVQDTKRLHHIMEAKRQDESAEELTRLACTWMGYPTCTPYMAG